MSYFNPSGIDKELIDCMLFYQRFPDHWYTRFRVVMGSIGRFGCFFRSRRPPIGFSEISENMGQKIRQHEEIYQELKKQATGKNVKLKTQEKLCFSKLSQDAILYICSYLDTGDLLMWEIVSKKYRALSRLEAQDLLWKPRCKSSLEYFNIPAENQKEWVVNCSHFQFVDYRKMYFQFGLALGKELEELVDPDDQHMNFTFSSPGAHNLAVCIHYESDNCSKSNPCHFSTIRHFIHVFINQNEDKNIGLVSTPNHFYNNRRRIACKVLIALGNSIIPNSMPI